MGSGLEINNDTQFYINNTKLCQELFNNRFYIGCKTIHRFAPKKDVFFAVNPLDKKEVRFTYIDRMVHDAVYTIYRSVLEKNNGISCSFEITYQKIMSVMSGNPRQTNLKSNNARRVVLRDSLLKLASTDIFIDASSLCSGEPPENYIFYGRLIQLREITPPEGSEQGKSKAGKTDRFEVSGTMPLFAYAEAAGKNNAQIVFYPAKVLDYPVYNLSKLDDEAKKTYPAALSPLKGKSYPRKADRFLSKADEYELSANTKKKSPLTYENVLDRMMIKHYLIRRIMILRNGSFSTKNKNINEISFIYSATIQKRKYWLGLIPELYGKYYKVNRKWRPDLPESAAYTLSSFFDDLDESKKIRNDVAEYTEALLCSWLYHGFINDASKKTDGDMITGVSINDAGEYLSEVIYFESENSKYKKIYCHICESQDEGQNEVLNHKQSRESCRRISGGLYAYHLSNLKKKPERFELENAKQYSVIFYAAAKPEDSIGYLSDEEAAAGSADEKKPKNEIVFLCADSFIYPDDRRKHYKENMSENQ